MTRAEPRESSLIVHVLHEGVTACGFGHGMFPGEWPAGHRWTWLHDVENVTCPKCLEALKKGTAQADCSEKRSKNRPGCG